MNSNDEPNRSWRNATPIDESDDAMIVPLTPDPTVGRGEIRESLHDFHGNLEFEKRVAARLLDVLIRAGLVLALVLLCYRIFSPFLHLMLWAVILAVALYPLHQALASRMGGKQGLAATLLVVASTLLIVVPTALLASSLADSIHELINHVRDNSLQIPEPPASVATWPLVGGKAHALWSQAHADLPGLVQSMQPKSGDLAKKALGIVASMGGGLLEFLASFIVAGIIMAFGAAGAKTAQAIFERIVGLVRGEALTQLSTATIRSVATGVLGVAAIQALILGLSFIVAGIPLAGVWALIVLVLGVAQLPALMVTLPVIGYLWSSGDYSTTAAIGYSVLLIVGGSADNVLKPLLLGRGVDAPMPVILLGALGGMASSGILGMFIGAILLALGYQIFMYWVAQNPEVRPAKSAPAAQADA